MKPPQIPYIDASLVDNAVSIWKSGGLVAIPTETVYGLGADATNGSAIAGIYKVKARPQFNPLIVHVANAATARRYVVWNDKAERLAAAFWPGPLTLVLPRVADCPISELVSAGGDTLAIRIPAHPVAQQLLRAFGGGIAAPSANRSGRVSPTTAPHVEEELGGAIPLVIDGGACEVGLESTVIDLTGDVPGILRPGSITQEQLNTVIPVQGRDNNGEGLKSPGMLESHYAPSIKVRLNATDVTNDEALLAFGTPLSGAGAMLNLSPTSDLIESAANLFAHLRALDHPRWRAIAVMPVPYEGIGTAINDRLTRAAA